MRQRGGPATARLSAAALALALGTPRAADLPAEDWADLLELARRERCAALAWRRGAAVIRSHAPPDVAERWRQVAIATAVRGHAQLAAVAEVASRLERSGVRVVTLKGAPLAAALYGDPVVRACADVDWFVEPRDRHRTREVLVEAGWHLADGAPPWEETFERQSPHGSMWVEVHSSLLHPRFAYLPVPPPESEHADVCGVAMRRHHGALVPAYLGAHLAAHSFPPLLWDVDFLTLWDGLDDAARAGARAAARRAGLARYLAWAERRAHAVRRAAAGDVRALRTLGIGADRADRHPMWRHVWLAPTPRAAGRGLAAWVWPVWVRGDGVAGVVRRAASHWREAVRDERRELAAGASGPGATAAPPAVARVDAPTLLEVAREVVGAGGELWIEVTGRSMLPALAPGDRVLLGRAAERPRRGDIVLVDVSGRPVLHRVVSSRCEAVTTRGDACTENDEPVARAVVVGHVVAVRRGEDMVPPAGSGSSLGASAAGDLRHAAARLGRAMHLRART